MEKPNDSVKGVAPGFLLLPAREYDWELCTRIQIEIPNEGSITSLLNRFEAQHDLKFPGEDEFCLFGDNLLLLWEVVRVLFVSKKYPDLEDDQCMNVVAIEIKEDTIIVHGEIIRSL